MNTALESQGREIENRPQREEDERRKRLSVRANPSIRHTRRRRFGEVQDVAPSLPAIHTKGIQNRERDRLDLPVRRVHEQNAPAGLVRKFR